MKRVITLGGCGLGLVLSGFTQAEIPRAGSEVTTFDTLAMSPGGDQIATVDFRSAANSGPSYHAKVVIRSAHGGNTLDSLDPCSRCKYTDLTFGPQNVLAFIGRRSSEDAASLYLASPGKPASPIATLPPSAHQLRWSPDGQQIGVLVTANAKGVLSPVQPGARQVGEIGGSADVQRIAVISKQGGQLRTISPPDQFIYEFSWLHDGSGFIASSATGDGNANWWSATLNLINAETGASSLVARPKLQARNPCILADGSTVAFVGGLMSDFVSEGGDIWTVPLAGGTPVDVTPGFRGTFTSIACTSGGIKPQS
jgi:dipeptidyl aminopeptidase/acylaminoacyl peptidase